MFSPPKFESPKHGGESLAPPSVGMHAFSSATASLPTTIAQNVENSNNGELSTRRTPLTTYQSPRTPINQFQIADIKQQYQSSSSSSFAPPQLQSQQQKQQEQQPNSTMHRTTSFALPSTNQSQMQQQQQQQSSTNRSLIESQNQFPQSRFQNRYQEFQSRTSQLTHQSYDQFPTSMSYRQLENTSNQSQLAPPIIPRIPFEQQSPPPSSHKRQFLQQNQLYQSKDTNAFQKSAQKYSQQQQQQQQQHFSNFSTTDYVLLSGSKLNLSSAPILQASTTTAPISQVLAQSNVNAISNPASASHPLCNCSESSWSLVRDQLRQIKQLSNDHLFAQQETQRLRDSNEDLSTANSSMSSQITLLEQKILLQSKESTSKLNMARDKAKQLETFNKDLFTKLNFYEQSMLRYETEFKEMEAAHQEKLKMLEDEKAQLRLSLEALHDTMNEAITESEAKHRAKYDTKNAKIKQIKDQLATDKELIESYQRELVDLQTENKILKDEINSIQQSYLSIQHESQAHLSKAQNLDQQLQESLRQSEEQRRKFDEQQQQISVLFESQQLDGEEKMKSFQQFNQQQISNLMVESSQLKNLLHEQSSKCGLLEAQLAHLHSSSTSAFQSLLVLVNSKGRSENNDEQYLLQIDSSNGIPDSNNLNNSNSNPFMQTDYFEELRFQLLKLLQSKHALKKKKKALVSKTSEYKETVNELKQTLHQLASERQDDILHNESQAIHIQQLLHQNQHLHQLELTNSNTLPNNHHASLASLSPIPNSQHKQSMMTPVAPPAHMMMQQQQQQQQTHHLASQPSNRLSLKNSQSYQSSSSSQSQQFIQQQMQQPFVHIEDHHNRNSINSNLSGFTSNNHLYNTFHSSSLANNSKNPYQISEEQSQNSYFSTSSHRPGIPTVTALPASGESQEQYLYQKRVDEVVELQHAHYKTIIDELKMNSTEKLNSAIQIIYALSKLLQASYIQIHRLSAKSAQQNAIISSYIDAAALLMPQNTSIQMKSALKTLKKCFNAAIFISSIRRESKKTTEKYQSQFTQVRGNKVLSNYNDLNAVISENSSSIFDQIKKIRDFEFDFESYSKIKLIIIGSEEPSKNPFNIPDKFNFKQILSLSQVLRFRDRFSDYQLAIPLISIDHSTRINQIQQQYQQNLEDLETQAADITRLEKENYVIETDNIHLKQLIVNLTEEKEEALRQLDEKNNQFEELQLVSNQQQQKITQLTSDCEAFIDKKLELNDLSSINADDSRREQPEID